MPPTLCKGTFIQGEVNVDMEGKDELWVLTDDSRNPRWESLVVE
jgi:hypothetical protein